MGFVRFGQFISRCNKSSDPTSPYVCFGRGKSYCLVHKRYFENSWCPDCSRSSRKLYKIMI
ncbi:hypothetical protein BD408DRAFT_348263 [Parasitella parasitica]|nr:hypothetical protein BD408DRAFT_348263 [Parasitella parasitica]